MHKFIFLLLIALPALAAEPKFHFQDCVIIVGGFYGNCHGTVQALRNGVGNAYDLYDVSLSCKNGMNTSATFKEYELKPYPGICESY
jgi:hypothetical protein